MKQLVNTKDDAQRVINRLKEEPHVVYDAETSGLDWKRNHIIGHVLTFGPSNLDSYYVPVRHAPGGNLEDCKPEPESTGWDERTNWFEDEIIPILSGGEKSIAYHNGAFDMRFKHKLGFIPPKKKVKDTMIAAYLVNELRPKLSLAACCIDEGVQEKKGDALYKRISEITNTPIPKNPAQLMGLLWSVRGDDDVVVDYSAGDGTSTWQLEKALDKKIAEPYYTNQFREYTLSKVAEVEYHLMPVIHKMMVNGIKIDMNYFDKLYEGISNDYNAAKQLIGDLNVRSPKEMKAYFEGHEVTDWPLTPKGRPSFNEKWLLTSEPGRAIIKARKFRTLRDTFLKPMKERHIIGDRLYPNYSQTRDENFGTKTGRLAAHDPNITAQPGKRQKDLGERFRKVYISDEGKNWVSSDYETCEIVVCCHYCKAKVWLEGFKKGIKAHQSVSNELDIPYQHAKTINLGLMTGMGKGALAEDLGLPIREANEVVNKYFAGLPEVKRFQKSSMATFKDRGFVSTLLGRRLRLDDSRFAYRALNRLTQGGNADIIKDRMVAMDDLADELGNTELILNVHDDISFQTDEEEKKMQMLNCMKDMNNVGLSLPIRVEYGSGPNWGVATFNEEGVI